MKQHFQILIVGGGNAGISLAAQLFIKDSSLDIGIMEPAEKHYYQPAWTLVGGGVMDAQSTERTEAEVMPQKATWIKEAAASFEPEQNTVVSATGARYTYDYLVAAPGIQLDWHKIKGLEGNLGKNGITSNYLYQTAPYTYECVKNLKKGQKAIFTNSNTPIKCGGAPMKVMYLSSDYWRREGIIKDVKIDYYTGGTILFGVAKYKAVLDKVVERYGIDVHLLHNLVEIDAANKVATFEVWQDGKVVDHVKDTFDMIHITPPQSAPDFIKNSPLAMPGNPFGWVDVDKGTLQHVRYANIFGLGDATSTPNAKTGAAVRKQVPVLVENLVSLMKTGKVGTANYNGYSSCPIVTGYGKLVLAEFDYNNVPMETFPFNQGKERWSMYMLKTKVLPWLYWNKILNGTA